MRVAYVIQGLPIACPCGVVIHSFQGPGTWGLWGFWGTDGERSELADGQRKNRGESHAALYLPAVCWRGGGSHSSGKTRRPTGWLSLATRRVKVRLIIRVLGPARDHQGANLLFSCGFYLCKFPGPSALIKSVICSSNVTDNPPAPASSRATYSRLLVTRFKAKQRLKDHT